MIISRTPRMMPARHPRPPTARTEAWKCPDPTSISRTFTRSKSHPPGRRMRHDVRAAMPDWPSVAADYDGVHVSWAGILTAEGQVIPAPELGSELVTMVRYWRSERTRWLHDVFGVPQPRPAPSLSGRVNNDLGVAATDDPTRRARDERVLSVLLRPNPFTTSTLSD